MPHMRWEAIVLAGGKLEAGFSQFGDFPSKAYLPISGRKMVDYVLEVIRSISSLTRVVMVVPEGAPSFPHTITATGGNSIVESMKSGFSKLLPETEMALLVMCDLPCLTKEGVEDFIAQCENAPAGLHYSFVSRRDSEKQFPGIPHTYVKTPEGEFCGGGLVAIVPAGFPRLVRFAGEATQSRKNVFKLAAILGVPFLLKFLLRRLSIREVEQRATQLLGFPAKGILSRFPEIAFNVDDSEGLARAKTFLKQKITA